MDNKLMNLLKNWPSGMVATSTWLKKMSISRQLAKKYVNSGWLTSVGKGAFKRTNDDINWQGGLYAIQRQLCLPIHLGGISAINYRGAGHYIRLNEEKLYLFSKEKRNLPTWFLNWNWSITPTLNYTTILPTEKGISEYEIGGFKLNTSTLERAILETLYLTPDNFDLVETYQITEGLKTLRPDLMQDLLIECKSVKVKRLFLYMSDKAELPVYRYLNNNKIYLGRGDRSIVKNGVYISKYGISIPKELAEYD